VAPEAGSTDGDRSDNGGRFSKAVATAAAIVALVAGAVGLTLRFDPGLAPCLGGHGATFTGAPVFPNYAYQQFLIDNGMSRRQASTYPDPTGIEIRYSYHAEDLRAQALLLQATLVSVDRDGGIHATVLSPFGNDQVGATGETVQTAFSVGPRCSEIGGSSIFMQLPQGRGHYQTVLELFLGHDENRLALTQTPIFDG
jgi:hypothetical protein